MATLRDRLVHANTAKQLVARQQEGLSFLADIGMDDEEVALSMHKIRMATCFDDPKFCNYGVARCLNGYCGS